MTLHNFRIGYQGGGTRAQSRVEVPEQDGNYPSADMFGVLPAYGVYCRHAQDLHLSDLHLEQTSPDLRSAVFCEDVSGLVINSLRAPQAQGGSSVLRFHRVRDALVRGCRPGQGTEVFLKVSGAESEAISLMANDFSRVKQPVELTADVPPQSVSEVANRR